MRYITGIHALNLNCNLDTTGDWHQSALMWKDIDFRESSDSVFDDWGIEFGKTIPEHEDEQFAVANHIRACLDLIEAGDFAAAQGMRDDFVCNETYNLLIFDKVMLLREHNRWDEIDSFIGREYKMNWLEFKEAQCI